MQDTLGMPGLQVFSEIKFRYWMGRFPDVWGVGSLKPKMRKRGRAKGQEGQLYLV